MRRRYVKRIRRIDPAVPRWRYNCSKAIDTLDGVFQSANRLPGSPVGNYLQTCERVVVFGCVLVCSRINVGAHVITPTTWDQGIPPPQAIFFDSCQVLVESSAYHHSRLACFALLYAYFSKALPARLPMPQAVRYRKSNSRAQPKRWQGCLDLPVGTERSCLRKSILPNKLNLIPGTYYLETSPYDGLLKPTCTSILSSSRPHLGGCRTLVICS